MDKRAEIKRNYKETLRPAGIYQVKNLYNDKILIGSSINLDGALNRIKFELEFGLEKGLKYGHHAGDDLLQDWRSYGEDSFSFEILDYLTIEEYDRKKVEKELSVLLEMWLAQLQPYEPHGYNRRLEKK